MYTTLPREPQEENAPGTQTMDRPLREVDPELWQAIEDEKRRQHDKIELIASENYVSRAVLEAQGSVLTNKYAEGYPGKRYYGGCEYVDVAENLAIARAKELFGADHANVQPHSGAQANMAAYMAVLEPGDKILGMGLAFGGHLTHGYSINFSGKLYHAEAYAVSKETEYIDYDALEQQAKEFQPKMLVVGASAYPRIIDFERCRQIADACGAMLMVDMAHIAGLVAVGLHPSPVPYGDFVTTTTHKTLRGPRGGMVLCKAQYAKELDKSVFPGIQGGPLMHVIAAKAVAFQEALQPTFRDYQAQILANAKSMASSFEAAGLRLVSGGTDNHLMLVDVSPLNLTGRTAERVLDEVGITVNKNAIPYDPQPPAKASGIRVGTPAVTTRGFREAEMDAVARFIVDVLRAPDDAETKQRVSREVLDLCNRFPVPGIEN